MSEQIVELVATGNELLGGQSLNRHTQTLACLLQPLGLRLARETTVSDDLAAIQDALRGALQRAEVLFVTGGLGATTDDLTRESVAAVLGRSIHVDEPSWEIVKQKYAAFGRGPSPISIRQARVLDGAAVLKNPAGMAPGMRLDLDGKTMFILPGPPHEFLAIMETAVIPWLRAHLALPPPPLEQLFMICGLGESEIGSRMEKHGLPSREVEIAYCASPGRIELRLRAPREQAGAFAAAVAVARAELDNAIFAEQPITMEEVVGRLLQEKKATLSTAESCTGGLIGGRIVNVSGSSNYYLGGVVAYANEVKTRELGVPVEILQRHGAVSRETAHAMAEGVRRRFGSAYALAVTGIAGPSGGTTEKPVGLVYMAVATAGGCTVEERRFNGDRERIRNFAAQFSLDLLRRELLRS